MFTVTLGLEASGISSTCSPLASRYSRTPSTSRTGLGSLPAATVVAVFPATGADADAPPDAGGAAKAAEEMAATSARTGKGVRCFMGAYLGMPGHGILPRCREGGGALAA